MPYYVYAIHTDNTNNRLSGSFENFSDAQREENDMRAGNYPGDNYFVRMFFAENDREAEIKAEGLRQQYKRSPDVTR